MTHDDETTQLQREFWSIRDQISQIEEEVAPDRAEYDRLSQEADALRVQARAVAEKFKAVEAPMVGLHTRLAEINRMLGGKTGQPPRP